MPYHDSSRLHAQAFKFIHITIKSSVLVHRFHDLQLGSYLCSHPHCAVHIAHRLLLLWQALMVSFQTYIGREQYSAAFDIWPGKGCTVTPASCDATT